MAFPGAASSGHQARVGGALIATVAICLPSFLLVGAARPLWEQPRSFLPTRHAMAAIKAAASGILLAALQGPV